MTHGHVAGSDLPAIFLFSISDTDDLCLLYCSVLRTECTVR